MANSTGSADYMDTDPALFELIPSDLWSLLYLRLPGILMAATQVNPVRVGEVYAASETFSSKTLPLLLTSSPAASLPVLRISALTITQYDGQASTLRAFCTQLVNQIDSSPNQFPTEVAKMRSLFRCLEDPSIPREIETLNDFLSALKQRCQDPGLCERATRTVETLYQKNAFFQEINYRPTPSERPVPAKMMYPLTAPSTCELTISRGGSAMDLDMLSREKGLDGRLTPQASNARRSLGRCYRCNQSGRLAINCPLRNSSRIPVSSVEISLPTESKQLKD
ncbi:hypothetical protein EPUL_005625 [Erysiphe pulchra]|uniref:CCHC-type domain-containing protein n=1 Tax=Erysiphe pulchra TaxID=225359 RepID=A0A2S4PKK3_9PEZI|nr:hypothetical protein EPUL_005625 [Erysiphe pulchra]